MNRHLYPAKAWGNHHFCEYPNGEDLTKLKAVDFKGILGQLSPKKTGVNLGDIEMYNRKQNPKEIDFEYNKSLEATMDGFETVAGVKSLVTEEGLRDWLM